MCQGSVQLHLLLAALVKINRPKAGSGSWPQRLWELCRQMCATLDRSCPFTGPHRPNYQLDRKDQKMINVQNNAMVDIPEDLTESDKLPALLRPLLSKEGLTTH